MPFLLKKRRVFLLTIIVTLGFSGIFLTSTRVAFAQCASADGKFIALECFKDSTKLRDAYNTPPGELGPFLNKIFVGAISIGAILAVLRLAWAGFQYVASDLWSTKEHAKEIIRETLLGLFLLIAVYLILRQINPQILELKVTAERGSTEQTTAPATDTKSVFERMRRL
ncbi:MAG: hypothetical protein AAB947_00590 [Patescibacteria group bacterium]